MAHLSENLTVAAYDALDSIIRTVRVVWRLHCHFLIDRIDILECHLAVGKEFLGKLLIDNELTLSMADSDSMKVSYGEALEPRRIGGGHTCRHHLRNMTVDVVAEECRAVLCHLAEASVRKET